MTTSKAQHTPGPWTNKVSAWTVHGHAPWSVWAGDTQIAACRVITKDGEIAPYMERDDERAASNARLIAAAPKMKELLKRLDNVVLPNTLDTERRALLCEIEGEP